MRKFFTKIGHFFKKRWAILTTAVVALIIGSASGFAAGRANNFNNLAKVRQTQQQFYSRRFPGKNWGSQNGNNQNNQLPTPPNNSQAPDTQGGASAGNNHSNNGSSTQNGNGNSGNSNTAAAKGT